MKLKEQFKYDAVEDKIIHKRTFDADPSLKKAKQLRDLGYDENHSGHLSDSYMVAYFPDWVFAKIIKDAGLKWDDPAAKHAVLRAIQSGEYDKFRVWGGNLGREHDNRIIVGPSVKAKVEQHWEGKH